MHSLRTWLPSPPHRSAAGATSNSLHRARVRGTKGTPRHIVSANHPVVGTRGGSLVARPRLVALLVADVGGALKEPVRKAVGRLVDDAAQAVRTLAQLLQDERELRVDDGTRQAGGDFV